MWLKGISDVSHLLTALDTFCTEWKEKALGFRCCGVKSCSCCCFFFFFSALGPACFLRWAFDTFDSSSIVLWSDDSLTFWQQCTTNHVMWLPRWWTTLVPKHKNMQCRVQFKDIPVHLYLHNGQMASWKHLSMLDDLDHSVSNQARTTHSWALAFLFQRGWNLIMITSGTPNKSSSTSSLSQNFQMF